jgi:hypothetical protein
MFAVSGSLSLLISACLLRSSEAMLNPHQIR